VDVDFSDAHAVEHTASTHPKTSSAQTLDRAPVALPVAKGQYIGQRMDMHENAETTLVRDVEGIRIPSGEIFTLGKGTAVVITQALGGSFTVWTPEGLARIADSNADALGLEPVTKPTEAAPKAASGVAPKVEDKAVWDHLRTCYDPEIPVNIVDLGLVYDCVVEQPEGDPAKISVKMTLTAPGCGMGPTIAAEARSKIMSLPGVADAVVDLVWDPPWNQDMISEAGKMKLGLI
jgi:probable FeS assembly SUF system protein SufT